MSIFCCASGSESGAHKQTDGKETNDDEAQREINLYAGSK
jgi:hypothetical protein